MSTMTAVNLDDVYAAWGEAHGDYVLRLPVDVQVLTTEKARRSGVTPAAQGGSWIGTTLRWAIYARDGFACMYCKSRDLLTVDHFRPAKAGGECDPSNLITACGACNSGKKALTVRQWFRKLRARGIDTKALRHRIFRSLRRPIDRRLGYLLSQAPRQAVIPDALAEPARIE